jgi:HTH-type transcriptional regulator/antitoxin MqsA
MNQPEHPRCHQDGAPLRRDVRPLTLEFEGRGRSVDMPGWYCPECGEGIHDADDMKVSDAALQALRCTRGN